MKLLFKEEQKFTQWWLWVILIAIMILPIYGIYKQLIIGKPFGSKPMSDVGLIIFTICMLVFITLFFFMRLKTEIDQNEIRIRFFPFVKKRIAWKDIKNVEVLKYGFVGGWGIRFWTQYGTVYNTKGDEGLAIELTNGKKFLVGTQKKQELSEAIKSQIQKIKS